MTIYDYFLKASANKLKNDLVKSGKWKNWHSFPETKEKFCEFFNLEDDDRISNYWAFDRGSHIELSIMFDIPYKDPIGHIVYKINYNISGYKKPIVQIYNWGGYHGNIQFDFNNKYKLPIINSNKFDVINYDLSNEAICGKIEFNDSSLPEDIINSLLNIAPDLNSCFKKVINAFLDGTYEKMFDKYDIKIKNGNYMSSGLVVPNFCSLVNLIYLIKKKCNYDISIEDAIMLCLYNANQYGDTVLMNSNKTPDESIEFINSFSFWHRASTQDAENIELTLDQIEKLIKDVSKKLENNTNNFAEFKTIADKANKEIIEGLMNLVNETSKKYNINKKYLALCGFNDYTLFSPTKDADDWKI